MKSLNYLLVVLLLISACKDETRRTPVFPANYGSGMYIATENGISFYDGEIVNNQIYKKVNGSSVLNGNKIKFNEDEAYFVNDNHLFIVDIETFEAKGVVDGFINAVDFDFVSNERLFVVDKADSKVKVVDLLTLDITSDIETGDVTNPSFIISKWNRSIVLNSGAIADTLKDTTIIAIDNQDVLIPLADMMGSIEVGINPNSAVWINNLNILCKGVYDENNTVDDTESSLSQVDGFSMNLAWNVVLSNVYNAQNLISDPTGNQYFFTAFNGVYQMNNNGSSVTQFPLLPVSDVLFLTAANPNILYINDAVNNPETIYEYNITTGIFSDTIVVDGNVRDIAFY